MEATIEAARSIVSHFFFIKFILLLGTYLHSMTVSIVLRRAFVHPVHFFCVV